MGGYVTSSELHAYRWDANVGPPVPGEPGFLDLGLLPGAAGSDGLEVSADGQVVVGQSGNFAYRWDTTTLMVSLSDLPGGSTNSLAWNVSGAGNVVVGLSSQTSGFRGFRWTEGTGITALGDLPGGLNFSEARSVSADGQTIVGSSDSADGERAVRWLGDSPTPISLGLLAPTDNFSGALDVTPDGRVIVGVSGNTEMMQNQAFRWTEAGGFEALGDLPGGLLDSFAGGVNADGTVIVGVGNPGLDLPDEPFYWTQADGMRPLWEALAGVGVDLTGWNSFTTATDVSADGRVIVGTGITAEGEIAGYRAVVPVPEPGGLRTVFAGLLVVLLRRRRATLGP